MEVFSCFFALRDGLLHDGRFVALRDGLLRDGLLRDGLLHDGLFDDGLFDHGLFDHGLFDDVLAAACSLIWSSSIATWHSSFVSSAARRRPAKSHRPAPARILRSDRSVMVLH